MNPIQALGRLVEPAAFLRKLVGHDEAIAPKLAGDELHVGPPTLEQVRQRLKALELAGSWDAKVEGLNTLLGRLRAPEPLVAVADKAVELARHADRVPGERQHAQKLRDLERDALLAALGYMGNARAGTVGRQLALIDHADTALLRRTVLGAVLGRCEDAEAYERVARKANDLAKTHANRGTYGVESQGFLAYADEATKQLMAM